MMLHKAWMTVWNFIAELFGQKKDDAVATTTTTAPPLEKTDTARLDGYGNGVPGKPETDRALFRFGRPGSFYGKNIKVSMDDVLVMTVPDGNVRYEPGGGWLWKPRSDNDARLAIHGNYGGKYKTCTLKYNS